MIGRTATACLILLWACFALTGCSAQSSYFTTVKKIPCDDCSNAAVYANGIQVRQITGDEGSDWFGLAQLDHDSVQKAVAGSLENNGALAQGGQPPRYALDIDVKAVKIRAGVARLNMRYTLIRLSDSRTVLDTELATGASATGSNPGDLAAGAAIKENIRGFIYVLLTGKMPPQDAKGTLRERRTCTENCPQHVDPARP